MKQQYSELSKLYQENVVTHNTKPINEGWLDQLGARASGAVQGVKGFVGGGASQMSDDYNTQKFTTYLDNKIKEITNDLQSMGMDEGLVQRLTAGINAVKSQQLSQIASSGQQAQKFKTHQAKQVTLNASVPAKETEAQRKQRERQEYLRRVAEFEARF